MKIAVVEFLGRGGMIHYAYQWCQALAQHGDEVTLLTDRRFELDRLPRDFHLRRLFDLWDPKSADSHTPAPRHFLRRLGRGLRHYRSWFRLLRYVRRERPDVVQFGDIRFSGDALFLAWLHHRGVRLVDVCHNIRPFTGKRFSRGRLRHRWYRFLYSRFSVIFVHYESNRQRFCTTYGVARARTTVIPHGNEQLFMQLRDPAVQADDLRIRHHLPGRAPIVLFFGGLSPYKGIDVLIEAFRTVTQRHPQAFLVIAGMPLGGVDLRALQAHAEQAGVLNRLRLVARYIPASHVAAWFELAQVAVFPYRDIWQSGALQVALSFGVASIATRVGALPEMARNGKAALLVPPDDPLALAHGIDRLLSDARLRRTLGEAARREMAGPASWRTISEIARKTFQQWASAPHTAQRSRLVSSH